MKVKELFATRSDCYNDGRQLKKVKGIILHSVGCPQPDPYAFYKNWNKPNTSACVHAVVGESGEALQLLPWTKRAWHCGGACNDTHIGIEMTEPSFIKYTGGSGWEVTSGHTLNEVKKFAKATFDQAVDLCVYLCQEFDLNPLEDGVILSHAEAHKRGLASNHGDVEHIWSKVGLSMDSFRKAVSEMIGWTDVDVSPSPDKLPPDPDGLGTSILGTSKVSQDSIVSVLTSKGVPQSYIDLVPVYYKEAEIEGVLPELAIAQSCLETGWFTFQGDIKPDQNNFAGIGATGGGVSGNEFPTAEIGIRAQIQHLVAYASDKELSQPCVDPRFKYVSRGSAPILLWLSMPNNPLHVGWAADKDYAIKILGILNKFQDEETRRQSSNLSPEPEEFWYRVRRSWEDEASQIGAYKDLNLAKEAAKNAPGYNVYDPDGRKMYMSPEPFKPYLVKVDADVLNIRSKPNGGIVGLITDHGVYTIEEVSPDKKWGRLRSGAGWIALDYTHKIEK